MRWRTARNFVRALCLVGVNVGIAMVLLPMVYWLVVSIMVDAGATHVHVEDLAFMFPYGLPVTLVSMGGLLCVDRGTRRGSSKALCLVVAIGGIAMTVAALPCVFLGIWECSRTVGNEDTTVDEPSGNPILGGGLIVVGVFMLIFAPQIAYAAVSGLRRARR